LVTRRRPKKAFSIISSANEGKADANGPARNWRWHRTTALPADGALTSPSRVVRIARGSSTVVMRVEGEP
jgi:hypothetical protein